MHADEVEAGEGWLSAAERERLAELREGSVEKRVRQWRLGRYAAKSACRRFMDAEWRAITIANDEHGAPHLSGIETPPFLSISHSGDESLVAVAERRLGVDIELRRPWHASPMGLARRVCDEAEFRRWFDGLDDDEAGRRLIRLWVLKEAAAKATGLGFQGRPQAFVVESMDDERAMLTHQGRRFDARLRDEGERVMAVAWEG